MGDRATSDRASAAAGESSSATNEWAAGKRSLTERLPVQRKAAPPTGDGAGAAPPARPATARDGDDPFAFHLAPVQRATATASAASAGVPAHEAASTPSAVAGLDELDGLETDEQDEDGRPASSVAAPAQPVAAPDEGGGVTDHHVGDVTSLAIDSPGAPSPTQAYYFEGVGSNMSSRPGQPRPGTNRKLEVSSAGELVEEALAPMGGRPSTDPADPTASPTPRPTDHPNAASMFNVMNHDEGLPRQRLRKRGKRRGPRSPR